jgi:hypothetical protein
MINDCRINDTIYVPTASVICTVKAEHARLELFELVTSSLMREIQTAEMSKICLATW